MNCTSTTCLCPKASASKSASGRTTTTAISIWRLVWVARCVEWRFSGRLDRDICQRHLARIRSARCNEEHVDLVYATVDPVVGSSQQVVQHWERLDTTAPVFMGALKTKPWSGAKWSETLQHMVH